MRHTLLAVAVSLAVVSRTDASETAQQMLAPSLPQMTTWRRDLHAHPELGNHEQRTAAFIAQTLKTLGYEVRTGIAHTGVVGVLTGGKPGPRLAIRADMDALPVTEEPGLPFASTVKAEYRGTSVGVMHACGHDAHMAMTLGVATALAQHRADLAGSVMLIFQPAEEGPPPGEEGASLMVKEGVFTDFKPDAIFGMHVVSTLPVGVVGVRAGATMASSDAFRMTVHGRQSHGATPWKGVDPIVAAAQIVTDAQVIVSRQLDINKQPAVLTFGTFNGGTRFNIIPDSVELSGTIRTFDIGMRQQIFDSLRAVAEHVAAANGASVTAQIPSADSTNPVTTNDPALTERVRASLQKALGGSAVVDADRWTASEDFPYFGLGAPAPSVYFFVGATPQGQDLATAPTNHSPRFFLDEGALAGGSAAMLQAALDYLGYDG